MQEGLNPLLRGMARFYLLLSGMILLLAGVMLIGVWRGRFVEKEIAWDLATANDGQLFEVCIDGGRCKPVEVTRVGDTWHAIVRVSRGEHRFSVRGCTVSGACSPESSAINVVAK